MRSQSKALVAVAALCAFLLIPSGAALAAPPVTTIDPTVENVTYTTADVKGTVEVNGGYAYYSFETSTDGGSNWSGFVAEDFFQGSGPNEVSKTLTGLKPGQEYKVRLTASNFEDPEVHSAEPNPGFTTLAVPSDPVVTVEPASEVAYTTATLKGAIDPEASPIPLSYRFEYSTDAGAQFWSGAGHGQLDASEAAGTDPIEREVDLTDLQPGTTYYYRLVASNGNEFRSPEPFLSFTTDAVGPPVVSIGPVSAITGDSAHFEGTIDPGSSADNPAFDVDWHFECQPSCQLDQNGPNPVPAGSSGPVVVTADATDLEPNTDYTVKLVGANKGGSEEDQTTFATEAVPPIVETLPPAVIDDDSAWIGGKVNPRNSPTTYYIELADNPSFTGSTQILGSKGGNAGSGNDLELVNHQAEGLSVSTTYYYRVVAQGAGGASGAVESFTTWAQALPAGGGLPDGRVYEKVSPLDKGSSDIDPVVLKGAFSQASPTGDAVAYPSVGNFSGQSGGSISNQYLSRRGPGGWSTKGLNPPMDPIKAAGAVPDYHWLSPDLSFGAVYAYRANDDASVLYLQNTATGSLTELAARPADLGNSPVLVAGSSPQSAHFLIASAQQLLPGAPSENDGLYEWVEGQIKNVGIFPDGTPIANGINGTVYLADGRGTGATALRLSASHAISEDGSRIYFHVGNEDGTLYVRENGSATRPVSFAESMAAPDASAGDARFQLARASDGSIAFFTSTKSLTPDSVSGSTDTPIPAAGKSLYRWDANAPDGSRLSDITTADPTGPDVLRVVGGSDDATVVYFEARGELTPEATDGFVHLYVWRQGIGTDLVADDVQVDARARTTPDGLHIAFASRSQPTAYDTAGYRQLYLYDLANGNLHCVSCSPRAAKSVADASFATDLDSLLGNPAYRPRNLSADGSRFFFDSSEALIPSDSNGKIDVYEWTAGGPHLISTGTSNRDSKFVDASASGDDVFLATGESLVYSDTDDLVDMYDARVGGVREPAPVPSCQGDECQRTPTPPPTFETPGSSSYRGSSAPMSGKRCAGGKEVRRKGRCVQRNARCSRNATGRKCKRKAGTRRGSGKGRASHGTR